MPSAATYRVEGPRTEAVEIRDINKGFKQGSGGQTPCALTWSPEEGGASRLACIICESSILEGAPVRLKRDFTSGPPSWPASRKCFGWIATLIGLSAAAVSSSRASGGMYEPAVPLKCH